MEISQYIKELLLLNDCVIIPDFGGFVANYKPASIENNQFFPPAKEVAFNNKLTSNDGLLVNYISDVEGIGYFEARQKLENFVEETQLNLERNRNVYFEGVGYLHYDSRENLQFEPQLKQNLLVESYGLQNFSYEKLYQRQMPKPAFKVEYREPVPVVFQKRKLQKLVVAVPLLMAMALIPMKNNKEYLSKSDMGLWDAIMQSAPVVSTNPTEQTPADFTSEIVSQPVVEMKYFIIGGSFRSEENANKYLEQLKQQGYSGKNLGIFKGLHRIAMKGFSTMEEAQKELNSIRYQNPQSGVWIHVNE
ncbi:MAG: SPOR domain-containing protein [Prolixibacteraceae bacterium]|nr:SPOR domain-containing protein [Prolixibacteraceae bacterium]